MTRRLGFAGWLALITLGGFGLRVGYVLVFRADHVPFGGDAVYFDKLADLLAQGWAFNAPPGLVTERSLPLAEHPPIYPMWLAIASWFGSGHEVGQTAHMLWSCVMGAGTIVLCGLAGREIAGRRCGLIAAALAAVYPNIWVHDGMLLSETAAIFVASLVVYLAYRYWHDRSYLRVGLLGLACGIAALTRAELVLAVAFVVAPLALLARDVAWSRRILQFVVGGLAALVVITPWVAYNMSRFRDPVYISIGYGGTIAAANCDDTYYGGNIGWKNYGCGYERAAKVMKPEMDPSEGENALQEEAMRYIRSHSSRLPVVVAARLARIVGVLHPTTDIRFDRFVMQREAVVAWSTLITWYLLVPFAVAGAVILRRRRVPIAPLLAFPAIVLIAVAITFAQLRYRAPAEPAVVLLASVTFARLFRKRPGVDPTIPDSDPADSDGAGSDPGVSDDPRRAVPARP
jgi:4-amino-4-deoxy-L-arabinose transferase-like glycosyltransferase